MTAIIHGNRTPYILRSLFIEKWPRLIAERNPLTIYGLWALTADPNWFQYRNYISCLEAYWETGDTYYLELALDEHLMLPDISDGSYIGHLYEIYYIIQYLVLENYLDEAKKLEWHRRLKILADRMLTMYRIGDFDQCLTYLIYWKLLDKYLDTSYVSQVPDVVTWIDEFMDARDFSGGPRDASSEYEFSTFKLLVFGAAAYGKDIFTWFDNWATQYARYLKFYISTDYREAVAWGDQQGDNGSKKHEFHVIPLMYSMAGLGYETIPLISIARRLGQLQPTVDYPYSVYSMATDLYPFICDPELILSTVEEVPLEQGVYVADGIGTTVFRNLLLLLQLHFPKSVREDGTLVSMEDHHYAGAFANYAVRYLGVQVIPRPCGYGIGGNEFFNFNSCCMKGDGWWWLREFLFSTFINGILVSEGRTYGPASKYHHALGGYFFTAENEYEDCEIHTRFEFNTNTLQFKVTDTWTSPGTFDSRFADLPAFQRCIHALSPIEMIDTNVLQWQTSDITVKCTYTMLDVNGNNVTPNIVIEPNPRLLNSLNYYRAFVESSTDLYNGKLILNYEIIDNSPPPPPPQGIIPAGPADLVIINNTDDAYGKTAGWIRYPGQGVNGEVDYVAAGDGSEKAEWHANVVPGKYKVSVTWSPMANRATNAPFTVKLDDNTLINVAVNQELIPDSFTDENGVQWFNIWEGDVDITGVLKVCLYNNSDEFVIADATRIEKTGDITPPPVVFPIVYNCNNLEFKAYPDRLEISGTIPKF